MNAIASFLTGFGATVLGLLVFVSYRFFEVQSLFENYLPLDGSIRQVASYLVAFVVVFSLLIFSANLDKFKLNRFADSGAWIKWVLFLFTLVINAYFWRLWEGDSQVGNPKLTIFFKAVIVIFFAIFDYAYNHLFVSSWMDKQALSKAFTSLSQLQAKENELQARVSKLSASLSELIAREDPKVCPRCGKTFDNSNQRNGHLRSCQSTFKNSNNEL
ncbi:hypothetical protein [Ekhidna sp.]|uniref:hypothetical protein n=1 Tax=Ekhidna sp. TaxID=2608089 RepID=UPI003299196C